ncbi:DUF4468 domain-containing protein [Pedobacter sp. UC225_65]|uniref:DUF4468 domain-containing protein n=1 Tax=Pedobacter sp. UC225_65 TaxID=3350173 RepID=UPI0036733226
MPFNKDIQKRQGNLAFFNGLRMKLMLSFFLLLLGAVQVRAQEENLLPVDEQGKFIYYEVVDLKDKTKEVLKLRAEDYLKKQGKGLKFRLTIGDTSFVADGKMVVDKTLIVMSHPSGEILYRFYVEVKDGRYRFWLSDFNFIPYQRDRYGNFVPSTHVATPLEKDQGKLNASQWKEYQLQAASHAKKMAFNFKQYMANQQLVVKPAAVQKIVDKNW